MFAGIITSAKLNGSSVSFRMFGRSTPHGALRHETFSIEDDGAKAARKYLECVDNKTFCYVFNQYDDGCLNRYLWDAVDNDWKIKGLDAAVIKNGKATVVF